GAFDYYHRKWWRNGPRLCAQHVRSTSRSGSAGECVLGLIQRHWAFGRAAAGPSDTAAVAVSSCAIGRLLHETELRSMAKPIRPAGMKPASLVRTLCLVAFVALQARSETFALKDGDRVVFYGDSITDQRLYTTFTETYVVTRFPKLDVSFVHSGWGGDRVTGGGGGPIDSRLRRAVLAYTPTVMTIMLGM